MINSFTLVVPVAGLAIGAGTTWLVLKAKLKHEFDRANGESQAERAVLKERLAGREQELLKLQANFADAVVNRDVARDENSQLKAELEGERRAAEERSKSFNRVTEELSEKFKPLSRDALKDNNESFLELAKSTLKKYHVNAKDDLKSRQEALNHV